jgi:hypothetical protein
MTWAPVGLANAGKLKQLLTASTIGRSNQAFVFTVACLRREAPLPSLSRHDQIARLQLLAVQLQPAAAACAAWCFQRMVSGFTVEVRNRVSAIVVPKRRATRSAMLSCCVKSTMSSALMTSRAT